MKHHIHHPLFKTMAVIIASIAAITGLSMMSHAGFDEHKATGEVTKNNTQSGHNQGEKEHVSDKRNNNIYTPIIKQFDGKKTTLQNILFLLKEIEKW